MKYLQFACLTFLCLLKGFLVAGFTQEEEKFHKAAKNGKLEDVKSWLGAGVNVNVRDPHDSSTALHWASLHGHEEVVKVLIAAGANLYLKDSEDYQTALQFAQMRNRHEVVRILQDAIRNQKAFHIAAQNGDVETVNGMLENEDMNMNVNVKDQLFGRTALHVASMNGRVPVVTALINAGANKDARDNNFRTPLDLAKKSVVAALQEVPVPDDGDESGDDGNVSDEADQDGGDGDDGEAGQVGDDDDDAAKAGEEAAAPET